MNEEQQHALFDIQSALPPEMFNLAAEWADELADIPEGPELGRFVDAIALEVYRELKLKPPDMPLNPVMDRNIAINNIGYLLTLILKKANPEESETFQRGMVFAFVELLRERMRGN